MARVITPMKYGERKCVFYEAMMNQESEIEDAFRRVFQKYPEFAWSKEQIIIAELQYAKGKYAETVRLMLRYILLSQELEYGSVLRCSLLRQMENMVSALYRNNLTSDGRFAKALLHLFGIDYSGSLTRKGMSLSQIQHMGKKQMYTLAKCGNRAAYEIVDAGYVIEPSCCIV